MSSTSTPRRWVASSASATSWSSNSDTGPRISAPAGVAVISRTSRVKTAYCCATAPNRSLNTSPFTTCLASAAAGAAPPRRSVATNDKTAAAAGSLRRSRARRGHALHQVTRGFPEGAGNRRVERHSPGRSAQGTAGAAGKITERSFSCHALRPLTPCHIHQDGPQQDKQAPLQTGPRSPRTSDI